MLRIECQRASSVPLLRLRGLGLFYSDARLLRGLNEQHFVRLWWLLQHLLRHRLQHLRHLMMDVLLVRHVLHHVLLLLLLLVQMMHVPVHAGVYDRMYRHGHRPAAGGRTLLVHRCGLRRRRRPDEHGLLSADEALLRPSSVQAQAGALHRGVVERGERVRPGEADVLNARSATSDATNARAAAAVVLVNIVSWLTTDRLTESNGNK